MSESASATSVDAGPPPAFHLLAKPTGAVCNLDCSYCFFLSKEMLYPGSRFRMANDLLETYIRQLIEAHSQVPEVAIAWQGGEPTMMGVEFFRRSVELPTAISSRASAPLHDPDQRHAAGRRLGRRSSSRTTSWSGLSIDGPREMHDAYRVKKGGNGQLRPGHARPGLSEDRMASTGTC